MTEQDLTRMSSLTANEIHRRNLLSNFIYRDYCNYSQRTFIEIMQ